MFNLKEKLNRFLDDLEEVEGEETNSSEEVLIANPEDFKNKKEEMASYLQSLKEEKVEEEKEEVTASYNPMDDFEPVTIPTSKVEMKPIVEPQTMVKTQITPTKPIIINTINTDNATIITDDLVITGDIITNAPLQFAGTIHGNIKSSNQVHIEGNVQGNIEASTAQIISSQVVGSIKCDGNVVVSENSAIQGDIHTASLLVDGTVNGSIYSTEKVKINGNAEIYGNVSAATISIEEGAVVQGNVKINMGR